jgi:riboflavin transporter FmnP
MKNTATSIIAKVAVLGAVAFVIMLAEIPLPFFPPFYKLDFSEVVVLMGGFALGPLPAVAIEALKIILNLMFTGTMTAYVGEIANFLIGLSFVLPAVIIYHRNKTRQNAIRGLLIGSVCLIVVGALLNGLVLLPAYSYFYHMPMDALIGMGSALIPAIKDRLTFVLFATAPFNLIKAVVTSLLTIALYKRISPILHR